jgi:hypothetical protein
MVEYILVPNTIAAGGEAPKGYHALTVRNGGRTTEDFIKAMMSLRGGVTRGEAEAALDLVRRAVVSELPRGGVNIKGFLRAWIAVQGPVPDAGAGLDPAANRLRAVVRFSREVQEAIAGSRTRRVSNAASGLYVAHVHDVASNTDDRLLTPGMAIEIYGGKMKLKGDDAAVGAYFLDAADEAAEGVKVPAAAIIRNGDKEIDLVVPPLPPGAYLLRVATQNSGSRDSLRKTPRSYTFPHVLYVGEAPPP